MPPKAKPSQDFVIIDDIRDGVVVLKDGSLRSVVMTTSVNFSLKSAEEQEATVFQFQNFLNSLDFSLQISILSRKLYIEDYLNGLREKERAQKNDLLRMQTAEYIQFIQEFVDMQNIMSKYFYVVVPFFVTSRAKESFFGNISGLFGGSSATKKKEAEDLASKNFEVNKEQLWQRTENVMDGLRSFGIKSILLKDDELRDLYYTLYNPGEDVKKTS